MKVREDLLQIAPANTRDEKGQPLEPEELPARNILVPANTPANTIEGQALGEYNAQIHVHGKLDEFAQPLRRQCRHCAHFDRGAWALYYRKLSNAGVEGWKELNQIRAGFAETNNASVIDRHTDESGDMDVEHALGSLGICHPFTEIYKDVIIVHPLSTCPQIDPMGNALPVLWEARGRKAARAASEQFDNLMRAALATKV